MKIKEFTQEEISEIGGMLWKTWDTIGMDVLQVEADMRGKKRYDITMRRNAVVEVVLDAGHLEMYGAYGDVDDMNLIKKFRQLDYKDQIKVAKKTAFTYKTYGM